MSRRVGFILNTRAGGGRVHGWLEAHRAAIDAVANGGPVLLVSHGGEIVAAVRQVIGAGCDTVVGGGGDGTLNTVASGLVNSDTLFGILPMGTLNHFARDVGVPEDFDAALAAIAARHHVRIDVGEVNGRYFLNNSSLGVYPEIVRDRERQQRKLGRNKWVAFAWALWGAIRRFPFLTVRLSVDGETATHRTPFVFVGNNAYQMQGLHMGTRSGLCDGVLSIYFADRPSRLQLAALALQALFGRLHQTREFRAHLSGELRVETAHHKLRVATDGEVREMQPPLLYRIRAGALRVIVPAPQPAEGTP